MKHLPRAMGVTGAPRDATTTQKKTPGRAIVAVPGQRSALVQSVSYWKEETDKAWEAAHRWKAEEAAKTADLRAQIAVIGALLPVNTGGTMRNDPPDAILAAVIRGLSR